MRVETEFGGDPPCWAHLFDDDEPEIIDLPEIAIAMRAGGIAWTQQSQDLSVELVVVESGQPPADRCEADADVLLVGVAGEGAIEVEGRLTFMWPGTTLLIAKRDRRSIQPTEGRFAYLMCSRRAEAWTEARI